MSSSSSSGPCIGIVSAGAMGAAVASAFTSRGCTVLTNLTGRSADTHKRAEEAGMQDVSLTELGKRARWVLSILPPSSAEKFATDFVAALKDGAISEKQVTFVDCNAVNPETVRRIAGHFTGTGVSFIDAGIVGGPPRGDYRPKFYAAVDKQDQALLGEFVALNEWGLLVKPLEGEGASIGDASALKMSYAGILKGTTGLYTAMILAAHAASPATANALMHELKASQPAVLHRITSSVPVMLPKAYRWVAEMEEIAGFVGGEEKEIYSGMAKIYSRIESSIKGDGADVDVLKEFVDEAKSL